MTIPQSAQYTACTAFLHFIDANDATARNVPIFYTHTQTLRGYLVKAKAEDTESQKDTKGMTKDKNQVKTNIFELMIDFTDIVSAFAAANSNTVLANRVNNFTSVFGKTRQNDIATLCRGILDEVKPFLPDLVDYTITLATLQEIYDLIDVYEGKIPETRTTVKGKTVNTTNRDDIFNLITDLMDNKILKVAVGFKKIDLDFYKRLIAAAAVDATTTKPAIVKVVLSDESGTRDFKMMTARSLDSDKPKKANTKGAITFRFAKGGLKDIEVPMPNGEPIKLTGIETKNGKTTKVVVPV